MYADSGLTALVAVIKLHIDMHRYSDALNELFSLRKSLKGLDKLSFSWAAHYPSDYRHFILKFLDDRNRVGAYALTRDRYATAAAYFLKYIKNHPEQLVPSFSTLQRKFKRQMNTPWHWRNTVEKTQSSEAAQSVRWQRLTRQKPMTLQWRMFMSGPAFRLALKGLAYVLPRSHNSEELTILARQHTFGPLVRNHRRSKKAVKREIARYLARVEQGGVIRHLSITT
ncbi:hypothetical protein GALMADRAFT_567803 [Galerina marginata CBS 339.88]|uniref:Uncharacterized protein n=1 Tax=Galerina marginata (strain CBS 339.88) TaxID=685588 RepID=A0A067SVL0_GALM3|nr:hypothetical protein GALMADRAFT_567803 [Galerina marginata CBS 339.88]